MKKYFQTKRATELYNRYNAEKIETLNVSRGNAKLISNDNTLFLIWNLPARMTCPNKTHNCSVFCYAVKAEILYKDCMPSRQRNFKESLKDDFADRMTFTILKAIRYDRKHRKVVVRIHESGDFYNVKYANAWLKVMENLKGENVVFIAYTKSFAYFDGISLPHNFRLRASIWADTKETDLATIKRNNWPIYTAVEHFQKGDKFTRCRCSDCATCGKCWAKYHDIRCEIH